VELGLVEQRYQAVLEVVMDQVNDFARFLSASTTFTAT
jgi:hypothetical protein